MARGAEESRRSESSRAQVMKDHRWGRVHSSQERDPSQDSWVREKAKQGVVFFFFWRSNLVIECKTESKQSRCGKREENPVGVTATGRNWTEAVGEGEVGNPWVEKQATCENLELETSFGLISSFY